MTTAPASADTVTGALRDRGIRRLEGDPRRDLGVAIDNYPSSPKDRFRPEDVTLNV